MVAEEACLPQLLEAIGGNDLALKRRKVILLNALGLEGQQISMAPARMAQSSNNKAREGDAKNGNDVFEEALAVLDKCFLTATNELMQCQRFRRRRQMSADTFEANAATLRELPSCRNFGEEADKAVRNQLLERAASRQIREHLLFQGMSLTPNGALEIGQHIGQTQREPKEPVGDTVV